MDPDKHPGLFVGRSQGGSGSLKKKLSKENDGSSYRRKVKLFNIDFVGQSGQYYNSRRIWFDVCIEYF